MTKYADFLKNKKKIDIATGHEPGPLNKCLFDFQDAIVKWAIRRGRAAIFADCGLGKTIMQLEWARNIHYYTGGDILILAPLAVGRQTQREGARFGVTVNICRKQGDVKEGINITNYEMLHNFDPSVFAGVVLDESSILKSFTGKYRNEIIEKFEGCQYKLACTATPAPNDYMELGNHSEFFGVMSRTEMLSMFFINDAGDTGKWRLKGHANKEFWKWVCSWAVMIRKPSDLGFEDNGFILPPLNVESQVVETDAPLEGTLFKIAARTMQERRTARKQSLKERCDKVAELVNNSDDKWLIWCDLNDESAYLKKILNDAVEVKGSDSQEHKENSMIGFANGDVRVLVTKPKIAGFGMNWQTCSNVVFVGLSDSYEAYYQAVRRCWRFGQKKQVNAYIVTSDLEGNIVKNIQRKEKDAMQMAEEMTVNMADISKENIRGKSNDTAEYKTNHANGPLWDVYLGDSIELIKNIETESIHYSVFSPPFASLFTYSNSERDLGNCSGFSEFEEHFSFLVSDLLRVIKKGRLVSFHCMNLPATITHDGFIGIKDFRGLLIKMFVDAGFIFHSEVVIWKDPLIQATRTKMLSLAHKQISKDSSMCGAGLPDYIITMRKPGKNEEPISHGRGFETYAGEMEEPKEGKKDDPRVNKYSHHVWQRYASPVWFDIRQTNTLNTIKSENDEKHICPLQLDAIERCLDLWSNKGDIVFSPFTGIGSEGYQAVKMKRKFLGFELKEAYYNTAISNLKKAETSGSQQTLF